MSCGVYALGLVRQPDGGLHMALMREDGSSVASGASVEALGDDIVRALREAEADDALYLAMRVPELIRPLVAHKIRTGPRVSGFGLTTPLWAALMVWRA